ncbi:MAG: hypothetical protein HFK06_00410 [Clostridia bacterium]|nr:hypothetical protein [Clostridia bacterium]
MGKKFAAFAVSLTLILSVFGFGACGSPDLHEHIWNEGEVTIQPTCTAEGEKTFNCTVKGCKETMTERTGMLAHEYDGGTVTQTPTCAEEGTKTFSCTACGNSYYEAIEKTAHVWDGGKLSVIPTLDAAGEIVYNCINCDAEKKGTAAPRADFGEQFQNTLPADFNWEYGYTADFENFEFVRLTETDAEQPDVWKAEGVEISANGIYSAGNAVIAYYVSGDLGLKATLSFVGEEENTRLSAKLIYAGKSVAVSEDNKDWNFEGTVNAAGEYIYLVFANAGEGKPAGSLTFTLACACVHIWNEGEITAPPTCSADGVKTFTCKECSATYTETVTDRPDHEYGGEWINASAEGHYLKCVNCGKNGTPVTHTMTDGEVITPPTNTEAGVMGTLCSVCGYESTREIPSLNHRPSSEYGKDENKHWLICDGHDDCGIKFGEAPHAYDELTAEKPATCKDDGYTVWRCVCGDTQTRVISKDTVEHKYDCKSVGESGHRDVCGVCGIETEIVAHAWIETGRQPATDVPGYVDYGCEACGETKREILPAEHAHEWGEGEITVQPTLTKEGEKLFACACGETKTEILPAKNSANFKNEFSLESNPNGGWSYGSAEYQFGEKEDFTFTAADKTGEFGWLNTDGENVKSDIRNDFIQVKEGFAVIAYTFDADVTVDVAFKLTGNGLNEGADTKFNVRVGIKNGDDVIYGKPEFFQSGTVEYKKKISFKEGDTIYFIIQHASGWDSGTPEITFTK